MLENLKVKWNKQSPDIKMLGRGVFWTMSGSLLSRGILFLAWILIARILGTEHYGEYGLIRNTVLMFASFAGAGMGVAATKFIAEYIDQDRPKAERIAALVTLVTVLAGIIIFVFAFVFAPLIAEKTMNAPWLVFEFRIAAVILLFTSLNSVQIGILEGLGLFRKVAVINSINSVVSLPLFIIGSYWGSTLGSVIAYGISSVLICILSAIVLYQQEKMNVLTLNYKDCWIEKHWILIFILPSILSGLAVIPLKWIADVMLVNNAGFSEFGIFSASLTINMIILGVSVTLNSPFLAIIARNKGGNNRHIEKLNLFMPWLLAIIMVLPFLCFPQLGGILFGQEYEGDVFNKTFVCVLLFTVVLMYKQGLVRMLVVYNLQWFGLISNIIWGISLIFSFLLLKDLGSIGLSIAYLIAYLVTLLMIYPIYIKRKYISLDLVVSVPIVLIWIILGVVAYLSLLDLNQTSQTFILIISAISILFLFKKIFKSA